MVIMSPKASLLFLSALLALGLSLENATETFREGTSDSLVTDRNLDRSSSTTGYADGRVSSTDGSVYVTEDEEEEEDEDHDYNEGGDEGSDMRRLIAATCPPKELISPCECINESPDPYSPQIQSISCHNVSADFDLKGYFKRLSNATEAKIYRNFILSESPVNTIPDHVFDDLIFIGIQFIKCRSLARIDPNAFEGPTSNMTMGFEARYTSLSNKNDSNVFEAIGKLVKLQFLTLTRNKLETLSAKFVKLDDLQEANLEGNLITAVDNYTFLETPKLVLLDLSENPIQFVDTFAFKQNPGLDDKYRFILHLRETRLSDDSFADGAFNQTSRPTTLSLSSDWDLTQLKADVFGPFMAANQYNSIILNQTPIKCDCSLSWVSEFLDSQYVKIVDLFCEDGRDIQEYTERDFANCV